MRWSKIKNIIILLLVVVNAFLLGQVGLREWRSRRDDLETRERMVAILARNGVAYQPAEVPGALDLSPRRVTLTPLGEGAAALLLDEVTAVGTSGTRTVYTGAWGEVTLSPSGALTAEFAPNAPLTEDDLLQRLSRLGVTLRESLRTPDSLTFHQLWEGVPVPGETALLTFQEGAPRTLTLRPLLGEEELLPAEGAITAATALTRLLDELSRGEGYVCSQITDMYPGYLSGGTGTVVTLTPAWFIETDTWRFVVDGLTGAVTALSTE